MKTALPVRQPQNRYGAIYNRIMTRTILKPGSSTNPEGFMHPDPARHHRGQIRKIIIFCELFSRAARPPEIALFFALLVGQVALEIASHGT